MKKTLVVAVVLAGSTIALAKGPQKPGNWHVTMTMEMPGLHQPVGTDVRYHVRAGKHDVTAYDWGEYLKFAASVWK